MHMLTQGSAQCGGSAPTTDVAIKYIDKPGTCALAVGYVWLATVHH